MSKLTEKLQELKSSLSKESGTVFDHSMLVTAHHAETEPKKRISLRKSINQSGKKLIESVKNQAGLKSLVAAVTGQAENSAASTLIEGLETWTISLLSPEKAFEKTTRKPNN